MKNSIFCIALLLLVSASAFGQTTENNKLNNLAVGLNVNQHQNDFGFGLDIISPYFFDSMVAIKIGGNLNWFEHTSSTKNNTIWSAYSNVQLGVRVRSFVIENKISVYGEGGAIALFPNKNFSTASSKIGGYGLFGFEFNPSSMFGYFVELGGVGTGAEANVLTGKPMYSNGFMTTVGFRVYL